jgi:butyryl-CoA dehydrogenase
MQQIQDQQEIMGAIADITMEIYAMESALLRTMKLAATRGETAAALSIAMTRLYLARGMERIESASRKIIAAVAEGDMLRTQLAILRRLAKHDPYNVIALQQQVTQAILDKGKYAAL